MVDVLDLVGDHHGAHRLASAAHKLRDEAVNVIEAVLGPTREDGGRFASIVAWEGAAPQPLAQLGERPHLSGADATAAGRAGSDAGMVVRYLTAAEPAPLAMLASGAGGTVVHVEQVLPPDRTAVVQQDSAFSGLHDALHVVEDGEFGPVLLSSTPDLPLRGLVAAGRVAFGDGELHLVMSPTGHLGGALLPVLPWLMVVLGLPLAIAATVLVEVLNRRRGRAEQLAVERSRLYDRQREVAETLQRSLLPPELPTCDGVDLAARYVAGTEDAEVGGDLYEVVVMSDGRLLTVSGDVMGRGVQAAAVMGAARQTIRALPSAGMAPHEILTELNRPGLLAIGWHGPGTSPSSSAPDLADSSRTA